LRAFLGRHRLRERDGFESSSAGTVPASLRAGRRARRLGYQAVQIIHYNVGHRKVDCEDELALYRRYLSPPRVG
ncbi:MAG: hypothetical protein QF735_07300, partial [Phycisphaeraceae bacterium]|nr:hypothetical protein [Phycisphaeraceae bacterium]